MSLDRANFPELGQEEGRKKLKRRAWWGSHVTFAGMICTIGGLIVAMIVFFAEGRSAEDVCRKVLCKENGHPASQFDCSECGPALPFVSMVGLYFPERAVLISFFSLGSVMLLIGICLNNIVLLSILHSTHYPNNGSTCTLKLLKLCIVVMPIIGMPCLAMVAIFSLRSNYAVHDMTVVLFFLAMMVWHVAVTVSFRKALRQGHEVVKAAYGIDSLSHPRHKRKWLTVGFVIFMSFLTAIMMNTATLFWIRWFGPIAQWCCIAGYAAFTFCHVDDALYLAGRSTLDTLSEISLESLNRVNVVAPAPL